LSDAVDVFWREPSVAVVLVLVDVWSLAFDEVPASEDVCAALDDCASLLLLLLLAVGAELSRCGRLGALSLAGGALFAGGGAESALFCGGGGGGGKADDRSCGVFWLTSEPKRSFSDGWVGFVSQEGGAWNVVLAAASTLVLDKERPPAKELAFEVSKDRATRLVY